MNSSRPYLLRAIHEWLVDNEKTPHILVNAHHVGVDVPAEFVEDGRILLNVSPQATGDLRLGKKLVTFYAMFGTDDCFITVPIPAIEAIYASENGRGMYFSEEDLGEDFDQDADSGNPPSSSGDDGGSDKSPPEGRSHLKVVK